MYSSGQEYGDVPPTTGLAKLSSASPSTSDYKLPITDVQTDRRNFPGYEKNQFFSMEDIQSGDTFGTTDADAETHGSAYEAYKSGEFSQKSGGYTKTYSAYKNGTKNIGGRKLSVSPLKRGR